MITFTTIKSSDLSTAMLKQLHEKGSCMDGAECVRFFNDCEAVFQPRMPAEIKGGGVMHAGREGNLKQIGGTVTVRMGTIIRTHYGYSSIVSCLNSCYGL